MRWRRARGEVFVAVGDEGREWVHVVGMLHHWDFVGLKKTQRVGGEQQVPGITFESD